jgi:hypothetical protein
MFEEDPGEHGGVAIKYERILGGEEAETGIGGPSSLSVFFLVLLGLQTSLFGAVLQLLDGLFYSFPHPTLTLPSLFLLQFR